MTWEVDVTPSANLEDWLVLFITSNNHYLTPKGLKRIRRKKMKGYTLGLKPTLRFPKHIVKDLIKELERYEYSSK